MDRDTQPDRWTEQTDKYGVSRDSPREREQDLMGAYDMIEGEEMFVIAAVDSDRAWLAISNDLEVDLTEWH